jgi:hypothetical protein
MPSPPLLGRLIRHGGGIIIPCCGLARRGSGERRPPIYLHIYMDYLHRLDSGRGQVDPGKRWAGVGLETGALFLGAPFPGVVKKVRLLADAAAAAERTTSQSRFRHGGGLAQSGPGIHPHRSLSRSPRGV